jgi:hypothetical protein
MGRTVKVNREAFDQVSLYSSCGMLLLVRHVKQAHSSSNSRWFAADHA